MNAIVRLHIVDAERTLELCEQLMDLGEVMAERERQHAELAGSSLG